MKLNKYTLMSGTLATALVLGACSTVSADENLEWSDEDNSGVANVMTEETNKFKYSVQEAVDAASERFEGVATEVELDEDDGVHYYEIEMENGEDEYEVKISADDLSISEEEIDRENDRGAAKEEQSKSIKETDSEFIGMEEAVQIAKDKVGGGDVTDKEFDKDDNDYEIELVYDGSEYDVEINATTGEVKDFDQDDESDEGSKDSDEEAASSSESDFIGMDEAVQIAKDKVGGGDVTDKEFDKDDNDYEIELVYDGSEYDVEINATTGEVKDFDQDDESDEGSKDSDEEAASSSDSDFIGMDEAVQVAKDKVGGGDVIDKEFDKDDNDYEIELVYDGSEYDVEINATTGEVTSIDQENKSGGEYANNIEFDGDHISSEEALNIALEAVGGGTVNEWDLDKEDNEYDIEIDYNGSEYEVEIHATTGKVIQVEQDD